MTRAEIVIPFYNEAGRLRGTIAALAAELKRSALIERGFAIRFWWADDGSTDGSGADLRALVVKSFVFPGVEHCFLHLAVNRGKGSALRFAIDELRERVKPNAVVAFWDADGELYPDALYAMIADVAGGAADIVFGSRFPRGGPSRIPPFHALANGLLTLLSNAFSGLKLTDAHCCAKAIRAELLFRLPFTSSAFDFEAEFAGLVGRLRPRPAKIAERHIAYERRRRSEGKKIGARDVLPQLRQALRCRFRQRPIDSGLE
jgi:glycosyltransferase involved in cell wall biosynthesis